MSRHVSRFQDCGVVYKDGSGSYSLTPYGELVLGQIQGLNFASFQREYFEGYVLSDLPLSFLGRIDELGDSDLVDDVMTVFQNVERVIEEAEEYVWGLTDRYNVMTFPHLEAATERGF